MKEISKSEYTKIAMILIEFSSKCETTWARVDLKHLKDLIAILRYYRQFSK